MADNRSEKRNQEHVQEADRLSKLYEATLKALKKEERFINLFESYHPKSVENFIAHYARQKTSWYHYGDNFHRYAQRRKNQWRESALTEFKQIFLKKLFNLKCRWVAGEMDLKGIEISLDFEQWEKDPLGAYAVEPITSHEFNCYLAYYDWETEEKADRWWEEGSASLALTFFHKHRTGFTDADDVVPEWFHWYDRQFGTAKLLELPTTRTDLEYDYSHIWSERIHKPTLPPQDRYWGGLSRLEKKELRENPEKMKAWQREQNKRYEERKRNTPQYKSLHVYNKEMMEELVGLTETPEVQKLYKAYRGWHKRTDGHEMIESDLIYLKQARENVPIDSHDDHRMAIKQAHRNYRRQKTREALLRLFDEYMDCQQQSQAFNWGEATIVRHTEYKDNLLAARKLLGEPENFDFLKKENLPKEL